MSSDAGVPGHRRPVRGPWSRALRGAWSTAACLACALSGAAAGAQGLVLSGDGAWLLDRGAGLAWPRCVEGMRWERDRCAGTPRTMERSEAIAHATARRAAEGVDWRLPRVPELRRLAQQTETVPPGAPPWLPDAPDGWYWSITAHVGAGAGNRYNYGTVMREQQGGDAPQLGAVNGWAVDLVAGTARGDVLRSSRLPVRLVRSLR